MAVCSRSHFVGKRQNVDEGYYGPPVENQGQIQVPADWPLDVGIDLERHHDDNDESRRHGEGHEVPGERRQPVDGRVDAADELTVLGVVSVLHDDEQDESTGKERHAQADQRFEEQDHHRGQRRCHTVRERVAGPRQWMVDRPNQRASASVYRVAKHGVVCERQRDGDAVQREIVEMPSKFRAVHRRRHEVAPSVIRQTLVGDVQEVVVHIAVANVDWAPVYIRHR